MSFKTHRGFTLLEVLLVVAAIGILAAIVIVAINPNEQLAKVRDAERQSEVSTLYDAIQQYAIDNNGNFPTPIENMNSNSSAEICRESKSCGSSYIDLTSDLTPTYISNIPEDPQVGSDDGTGYVVVKDENDRLSVEAQKTETESDFIAAGAASIPLLDRHTGATAAYSIRKLDSDYTGDAVRVRRPTDDVEVDVAFDSQGDISLDSSVSNVSEGTSDTSATVLGEFVGNSSYDNPDNLSSASDAVVDTWYDQSGNGNDATNATKAEQPQIVNSGSLVKENGKPALDFDGSDDELVLSSDLNLSGNLQFHAVLRAEKNGSTGGIIGDLEPGAGFSFTVQANNHYDLRFIDGEDPTSSNVEIGNFDIVTALFNGTREIYVNGTLDGTGPGTQKDAGTEAIGSRNGEAYIDANISELLVYDKNEGRSNIEANMNDYYSIY